MAETDEFVELCYLEKVQILFNLTLLNMYTSNEIKILVQLIPISYKQVHSSRTESRQNLARMVEDRQINASVKSLLRSALCIGAWSLNNINGAVVTGQ